MVLSKNLEVYGFASQYKKKDNPLIKCYKYVDDDIYIPSIYNVKSIKYDYVDFPDVNLESLGNVDKANDQMKVISEIEDMIINQTKLSNDEIFKLDANDPNTCISHPIMCDITTGFGKSAIGLYLISKFKGPALIVYRSDSICQSWMMSISKLLHIKPHIASNGTLGKHNLCLMSMQLALKNDFKRSDYIHYKTIILDEVDTLCTQRAVYQILEMYPKYLIGMTATPHREDGLDKVLDVFFTHRKNWIKRNKVYDDKKIVKLISVYTNINIGSTYHKSGTIDWNGISNKVSNIYERNILIRNICLMHQDMKGLIICKTKDHVQTLYNLFLEIGEDVAMYYDKYYNYIDSRITIITMSKGGRGFDDENVAVDHDGIRFGFIIKTLTMKNTDQANGRGRGKYTIIYTLVDDNTIMKNHIKQEQKNEGKCGAKLLDVYID